MTIFKYTKIVDTAQTEYSSQIVAADKVGNKVYLCIIPAE